MKKFSVGVTYEAGDEPLFEQIGFRADGGVLLNADRRVRVNTARGAVPFPSYGVRHNVSATIGEAVLYEDKDHVGATPVELTPVVNIDLVLTDSAEGKQRIGAFADMEVSGPSGRPAGFLTIPRSLLYGDINSYVVVITEGFPVEAGGARLGAEEPTRLYTFRALEDFGFIGQPQVGEDEIIVPVFDWPDNDLMVARRD